MRKLILKLAVASAVALPFFTAHAGADLNAVKARGVLRCGVSGEVPGFSEIDASGRWQGMDVDFCRALAAAVLGDAEKVKFVPLKASKRFPALQSKTIDLLVRNTTWTLSREVLLKVQFPAVLYYDGQAFMVPKAKRVKSLKDLNGATICVEKGTTHESRLLDSFAMRDMTAKPLVVDSAREVAEAFFAGKCAAYSSDASQLAAVRSRAPDGAKRYVILPERISKEPMGPVIRSGDQEWATLVGWIRHVLVAAEEFGVTRDNVGSLAEKMKHRRHAWQLVSGEDDWLARTLGISGNWAQRAIGAGGNYGEIYERNLGGASPLDIERGLNRLWTQGGLMYAPPIE